MVDFTDALSVVLGSSAFVMTAIMVLAYKYRHLQDMLLYHPRTPEDATEHCMSPMEVGISTFETVTITTSDGANLKGYFMHPPTEPTFTLVYFHGNAGNVGHRLPIARLLIASLRCSVLMMDYRGYGLSDPIVPTEEGLKIDAQAILDYTLRHPKSVRDRIFVLGTSLGGAVAVDVASRSSYGKVLAGVILENTFTSISDMADVVFSPLLLKVLPRAAVIVIPLLKYVVKPVVLFVGWWSIDRIRKVQTPLLFLSGAKDELVPPSHVRQLHAMAETAKCAELIQFVEFPSGKHNDLFAAKGYTNAIEQFIKEAVRKRHAQPIV